MLRNFAILANKSWYYPRFVPKLSDLEEFVCVELSNILENDEDRWNWSFYGENFNDRGKI